MNQTPREVIIAIFIFTGFWVVMVFAILLAGKYYLSVGRFRERMLSRWKPALVITAIFISSLGVGGSGFLNPYGIAVFCQAMIGLAIASGLPGFDPLPVTHAITQRQNVIRQIALLLVISLLMVFPALIIGSVGLDIGRQIFGEANYTQQAASSLLRTNKWLLFFFSAGWSRDCRRDHLSLGMPIPGVEID